MTNESNVNYPPCVNPACDYTLCFMERRDWNECPACGTEIPVSLRLNADMTGPREPEGNGHDAPAVSHASTSTT